MILTTVLKRLFGRGSSSAVKSEWSEERIERFSTPPQQNTNHPLEPDPLSGISWIAMVCFVEGVDPLMLSLPEPISLQIRQDLSRLNAMKPLDAYARCLEYLSEHEDPEKLQDSEPTEEGSSAEDSE